MGLDDRSFFTFEEENSDRVSVFYPHYMETTEFSNKPRPILEVLRDLEEMVLEHRKNVNTDLRLIREEIKRLENESNPKNSH